MALAVSRNLSCLVTIVQMNVLWTAYPFSEMMVEAQTFKSLSESMAASAWGWMPSLSSGSMHACYRVRLFIAGANPLLAFAVTAWCALRSTSLAKP